mgnify:CR=1 FL=1
MDTSTVTVLGSSALASALFQALKPGIAYSPWVDKLLALVIGGVIGYLQTQNVDGAILGALSMITTHSLVLNKTALGAKLDNMNITSLLRKPESLPQPDLAAQAPAEAIAVTNLMLNSATWAEGKARLAAYDAKYGSYANGGLLKLVSDVVRAMAG